MDEKCDQDSQKVFLFESRLLQLGGSEWFCGDVFGINAEWMNESSSSFILRVDGMIVIVNKSTSIAAIPVTRHRINQINDPGSRWPLQWCINFTGIILPLQSSYVLSHGLCRFNSGCRVPVSQRERGQQSWIDLTRRRKIYQKTDMTYATEMHM